MTVEPMISTWTLGLENAQLHSLTHITRTQPARLSVAPCPLPIFHKWLLAIRDSQPVSCNTVWFADSCLSAQESQPALPPRVRLMLVVKVWQLDGRLTDFLRERTGNSFEYTYIHTHPHRASEILSDPCLLSFPPSIRPSSLHDYVCN